MEATLKNMNMRIVNASDWCWVSSRFLIVSCSLQLLVLVYVIWVNVCCTPYPVNCPLPLACFHHYFTILNDARDFVIFFIRHATFKLSKDSGYLKWRGGGQYFVLILMSSLKSSHSKNAITFRFVFDVDRHCAWNKIFWSRMSRFVYREQCQTINSVNEGS